MRISLQWLRELVALDDLTADEISEKLTLIGLEVEELEAYESVRGALQGVVVGHVLAVKPHPDADKLRITTVDVGSAEALQIICGAPNVAEGQRVPVGLIGTTLYPQTGEPIALKKSKIRGVESFGMICAEDELGFGESHEGILVLNTEVPAGTPLAEVLPLYVDTVFGIGLTPNRTDAMSHFGVARDLAAALERQTKLPDIKSDKLGAFPCSITVEVQNTDRCPRYTGMMVRNVKVGPSPFWLQQRLLAVGQRPINNIVDLTNYILFEIGQPLHAFDAERIGGQRIVVRTVDKEQDFAALDDKIYRIGSEELMICDQNTPLCMAGVMGGTDSGVTEQTTSLFIESAYFHPAGIRRTSRRLGIHSETAYRFARGTDPSITVYALERFAELVTEVAGGECSEIHDQRFADFLPFVVDFSYSEAHKIIGEAIPVESINAILDRLSIVREHGDHPDQVRLHVPPYRTDVRRQQDVVEEILRIYGYNRIDAAPRLNAAPTPSHADSLREHEERVGDYLAANGLFEIRTNSLIAKRFATETAVVMLNPLSEENAVLRESMLPTGLDVVAHNLNRQQTDLRLFDFGKVYGKSLKSQNENKANGDNGDSNEPKKESKKNAGFTERQQLALYFTGSRQPDWWGTKKTELDYFDLKGAVQGVMDLLGLSLDEADRDTDPELAWGQTYLHRKREIGRGGRVHPSKLKDAGIKVPVFFAQLDWEYLRGLAHKNEIRFAELPKFPSVRRDVSMKVGGTTRFVDLETAIRQCDRKLIQQVELFDVYQPKGEDRVSYAISIVLLDENETLTDKRIQKVMDKVLQTLEKNPDVELRIG